MIPLITVSLFLLAPIGGFSQKGQQNITVHAVTDLAHEFTFYADHRFYSQYLPDQKGVTNWCNLYNFDFSNANLLILPGCDDRIAYSDKDIAAIHGFLNSGGGVVILGSEKGKSQNNLIKTFGAEFTGDARQPISAIGKTSQAKVESKGGSILSLERPGKWEVLISDSSRRAMMATRKVGKGTLLLASRSLAGSNPNASDSINAAIWRPLLPRIASGKTIDAAKEFNELGIESLEYNDDHGTFRLSYNEYMKPFAAAMVDVYKRSLPFIERRMGVPLSPGMASQVTLLATGGGGFSSGTVVALAVWWGGFPDREDGMIEFLTHESVHSWVLPFPEVWNEPIATWVGNLVMMDMGHGAEAMKRIQKTIERATKIDPEMKNYDLHGNLTGTGRELSGSEKNNMHWGKSFWVLEELRREKPDFLAEYFRLKREYSATGITKKYDINKTIELLGRAIGRDLTGWFNDHGIPNEPVRGLVLSPLTFDKSEYTTRRAKLMDRIPDGIAVFRGATVPSGDSQFFQFNNLMYFTGMEVPNLVLVIDGRSRTSTIFSTISEDEARGEGIPLDLVREPGKFNGIEYLLPLDRFTPYLTKMVESGNVIYTPFRVEELPGEVSAEKTNSLKASMTNDEWDGRLTRELQFVKQLKEKYSGANVKDCWTWVSDMRKIKSKAEIEVMREAGRIGTAAHLAFIKGTGVGVKEVDLANLFEYTCRQEGAQALAYNTIIMSAENIPYGHYHRYNRTLEDGDFVVLDAGPDYKYYDVDFSTSFPANGKFTAKQKELYELANAIREVCVNCYKPGITLSAVGQNVKKYLIENGYNPDEPRFKGLIRYGGYNHSVGMAVHDGMGTFSGPDEVLQEGFVFACDINMMYPEINIGVRLEDTVVITAEGCEVLSAGLPRTVNEMEVLLSNHRRQ